MRARTAPSSRTVLLAALAVVGSMAVASPPPPAEAAAPTDTITTIAGNGGASAPTEGAVAAAGSIGSPGHVAIAPEGTTFAGSTFFVAANVVWRVLPDGKIARFAGGGTADPAQGGPAREAALTGELWGLDVAPDGSVFVASRGGAVYRIDGSLTVQVRLADAAAKTMLTYSRGIAVDADGGVYVAVDQEQSAWTQSVQRLSPTGGTSTVFGGHGTGCNEIKNAEQVRINSQLNNPKDVALSDDGRTLFIADAYNHRVVRVPLDNVGAYTQANHSLCGTGSTGDAWEPAAVAAVGDTPFWLTRAGQVRNPGGAVAGTGVTGYAGDDGPAKDAQLAGNPAGVDAAPDGRLIVADSYNYRIRAITPPRRSVDVLKTGSGTVTSAPAGIDCGSSCSTTFRQDAAVTLTATPTAGWRLAGWGSTDCAGTGTCTVLAGSATALVHPTFVEIGVTNGLIAYDGHDKGVDDDDIFTVAPDGSGVVNRTDDPRLDGHADGADWQWNPTFSPDGRRFAFLNADGNDNTGIWVADVASNAMARVSSIFAVDGFSWSPDGKRIAYVEPPTLDRGVRTPSKLLVMDADGSHRRDLTPPGAAGITFHDPQLLADGSMLYIRRSEADGWDLWKLTGDVHQHVLDDTFASFALSPDGSRIVFTRAVPKPTPAGCPLPVCYQLWTAAVDGSGAAAITAPNQYMSGPVWAPNGDKLLATERVDAPPVAGLAQTENRVVVMNVDGSSLTSVGVEVFDEADWQRVPAPLQDDDGDAVANSSDNCVLVPNAAQADADDDTWGDPCDIDSDNDDVGNGIDSCPAVSNSDQADADGDGLGDACAGDTPGAPTGLTAAPSNGSVTLSWSRPSSGGSLTRYDVHIASADGATGRSIGVTTQTSFTVPDLQNGTTYWFFVLAEGPGGFAVSEYVSATPVAPAGSTGGDGSGGGGGGVDVPVVQPTVPVPQPTVPVPQPTTPNPEPERPDGPVDGGELPEQGERVEVDLEPGTPEDPFGLQLGPLTVWNTGEGSSLAVAGGQLPPGIEPAPLGEVVDIEPTGEVEPGQLVICMDAGFTDEEPVGPFRPEPALWHLTDSGELVNETARYLAAVPIGQDGQVCGAPTSFSPFFVAAEFVISPDTDGACTDVPASGFTDVGSSNVHRAAIDCAAFWRIALGTSPSTYDPHGEVSRAQMASFLVRLVERAGVVLPEGPDAFEDDDRSVHEQAVDRLAAAGIVRGTGEGRFGPDAVVSREQMASFLVRTYEHITGHALAYDLEGFTDTQQSTHRDAVAKAAAAGFTTGRTATLFAPAEPVRRDQMASFLTRTLSAVAARPAPASP